jgi:hypothetical protein
MGRASVCDASAAAKQITESGATPDDDGQAQIAGYACAVHVRAARSVWPWTHVLGAVDLSARSATDYVNDASSSARIDGSSV